MDGQLEADIHDVKGNIVNIQQKLAAAEDAHNEEIEKQLLDILLSLNNQLLTLYQMQNILLSNQAPSKPFLPDLPTPCCTPLN